MRSSASNSFGRPALGPLPVDGTSPRKDGLARAVRARKRLWGGLACLASATALLACSGDITDGVRPNSGFAAGTGTGDPFDPASLSTSGSTGAPQAGTGAVGVDGTAGTASSAAGAGAVANNTAGTGDVASTAGAAADTTDPNVVVAPVDCANDTSELPFRIMTRLNRAEYDNTVRDLLGDSTHLALTTLPEDRGDGGFDNNAAALSINSALVEDYERISETLATNALAAGSAGRAKVLTCDPNTVGEDACAQEIAQTFGTKAFRRPLEAGEADALLAVYSAGRDAGGSFEEAIAGLVQAALLSPHFLFRPEIDATPNAAGERTLTAPELANRLSYFLWSSMPDDTLLASAASGALLGAGELEAQITRMLGDAKSEALFTRFPTLWLQTVDISSRGRPEPAVFPEYDEELELAMEKETELFMRDMMNYEGNFMDFLDADFTYLNDRLAQHYGIAGQFGAEHQRVTLTTDERGGVLRQAAVLKASSPPTRSSPVFRGNYVLTRIIGEPPPPPPDELDIPDLEEAALNGVAPTTTRGKLELHRSSPACAPCHNLMDPIGFGLENYDGIGRFRTVEGGEPIDNTGTLTTGESFTGAAEMINLLKADPKIAKSVVKHMVTYAVGRATAPADTCTIDELATNFANSGNKISSLIADVASSRELLTRQQSE